MYWRAGFGFVSLWVASLTLAMSGIAALFMAGSQGGALCFLATAAVLAPPAQELISTIRHRLAPPKVALYCCITLLPLGLGVMMLDAVDTLEAEARKRGFASAGERARAADLKLGTPAELEAHLQAERAAAQERLCRERASRAPIACFPADHQKAAFAFFDSQIGHEEMEAIVRDALAQQRKALLEADKDCAPLLDRIDALALPLIAQSKDVTRSMAAAAWARHFSAAELTEMVARAKPGVSYLSLTTTDGLEKKARSLAPQIERGLDQEIQDWARRIVRDEPFWQAVLAGHAPVNGCKAAR